MSTSDSRRLPIVVTSSGCQYTLTANPKSDARQCAMEPACSSSAFSVSSSSSPNASLLSCNRKSVRFSDDKSTDAKKLCNFSDSKTSEGMKRYGKGETGSDREQTMDTDRERAKIQTFIHQYPSHKAMTSFLPDGGSLV